MSEMCIQYGYEDWRIKENIIFIFRYFKNIGELILANLW